MYSPGYCQASKEGCFASALIKKQRYWPKYVQGDRIAEHFENKVVGDVDAWPGVLDGVKFDIFAMKEPDYIMLVMSTYGTCDHRIGKENKREFKKMVQCVVPTFCTQK